MPIILSVAVVLLLMFAPTFIAALFEKRMVWPYGPLRKDDITPESMKAGDDKEINDYILRFINAALGWKFEYLGCCNDVKGGIYKVVYHFLVSHDRYTLAIIGGGKILHMRIWGTWLISKSDNENTYLSVDQQRCLEKDISKLGHSRLVSADNFVALYENHKSWIKSGVPSLKMYPAGSELEEYRRSRRYRFDYMEKLGVIRFIDSDKECWKYNLIGAIKLSLLTFVTIFRNILEGTHRPR